MNRKDFYRQGTTRRKDSGINTHNTAWKKASPGDGNKHDQTLSGWSLPSREPPYPTLRKRKITFKNWLFRGYVSSKEGILKHSFGGWWILSYDSCLKKHDHRKHRHQCFFAQRVQYKFSNSSHCECAAGITITVDAFKQEHFKLHPERLTLNLQITHLERKMIFQTIIFMFYVNLPGCSSMIFSLKHLKKKQR